MLRQTYHTPFVLPKKKTLTRTRCPAAILDGPCFVIFAVGSDWELERLTGRPDFVES